MHAQPRESKLILGLVARYGSYDRFPEDVKSFVGYRWTKREYYLRANANGQIGEYWEYARAFDPQLFHSPDTLHKFWIGNRWYKYDQNKRALRLTRATWTEEKLHRATRIFAERELGKPVEQATGEDFANHGLTGLLLIHGGSPRKAFQEAEIPYDTSKGIKPPGYANDTEQVARDFKDWARRAKFLKTYEYADGKTEQVVHLKKFDDIIDARWGTTIKNVGGFKKFLEIVKLPVLVETHAQGGTQFYLQHKAAFRDCFLQWARKNGYVKTYLDAKGEPKQFIELPQALQKLEGGKIFQTALVSYHGGMSEIPALIGRTILVKTQSNGSGLQFYLKDPVAFRHHAITILDEAGYLTNGKKQPTIVLPGTISNLAHTQSKISKLNDAIRLYHQTPEETRHQALARLTGIKVAVAKK